MAGASSDSGGERTEGTGGAVGAGGPSRADALFPRVCQGDERAFEAWMTEVEMPLRRSLARWARAVDVEAVMQETLLRVWLFARDRGHTLEGPEASLRWTLGVARNVARNEARRFRREDLTETGELPNPPDPDPPEPPSDPALARIIRRCLEALSRRPGEALRLRLDEGPTADDRTLAERLGMTLNTYLQNIVRARRQLSRCLADAGAPVEEHLP
jgi:DNA-directed RNA polymerase specialized sigma24 family protein